MLTARAATPGGQPSIMDSLIRGKEKRLERRRVTPFSSLQLTDQLSIRKAILELLYQLWGLLYCKNRNNSRRQLKFGAYLFEL